MMHEILSYSNIIVKIFNGANSSHNVLFLNTNKTSFLSEGNIYEKTEIVSAKNSRGLFSPPPPLKNVTITVL